MGAIVSSVEQEDPIDCWYIPGQKLRTGDRKIICKPTEGEDQRLVHIRYATGQRFKDATRDAFEGLLTRRLIEEGAFGRGSKKLTGWVINSAGRRRIGEFDVTGNPLSRQVNNDGIVAKRVLPVEGMIRKPSRPSIAQPSRARTTRKV